MHASNLRREVVSQNVSGLQRHTPSKGHLCSKDSNNKDMIRARKYNMNKTKLSLSALSIPAVKSFHDLPAAVLESIQNFARHTHDYEKKIPEGPRDNNEYIFILSHMSSRTALKKYVGVVFFPRISCKAVSNGKSSECFLHMSLCMFCVRSKMFLDCAM